MWRCGNPNCFVDCHTSGLGPLKLQAEEWNKRAPMPETQPTPPPGALGGPPEEGETP